MRTIDLDALKLARGGHSSPDEGLCLMEAVAFRAGESHSASPACTSQVLVEFGRDLNDLLGEDKRQLLKPLIDAMIDTSDDGLDQRRGYLALDWFIRTYTPAWLDLAGLSVKAAELRALPQIVDLSAFQDASPVILASSEEASAARNAAASAAASAATGAAVRAATVGNAARLAAAGDAARHAAVVSVGGATVGDAARLAAAGDAPWRNATWAAATWDAAVDAATWDAAVDAAVDAAAAATWDAASAAASPPLWDTAWDAAWDTAWVSMRDTINMLQDSAIQLLAQMIHPDHG